MAGPVKAMQVTHLLFSVKYIQSNLDDLHVMLVKFCHLLDL